MTRGLWLAPLLVCLAACASSLPGSGPMRQAVVEGASLNIEDIGGARKVAYALVRLNQTGVPLEQSIDAKPVFDLPTTPQITADGTIGISDDISVTIFESAAGGLFIPADPGTHAGNFVTLPTQQVDKEGNISIPFAGSIHVAGLAPVAVQRVIVGKLANRALDPQAIVTILNRRADSVNVLGDVGNATRFALDPGGEHLLGAISRAGGPKFPPYETTITLQRAGRVQKVLLSEVIAHPQQDIQLQGGDSVLVTHDPRYFLALGATGSSNQIGPVNRRFPFEDSQLSLADALAKAGGLSDDRANARAVFLYRFETPQVLGSLGMKLPADMPDLVPTIYLVDLADPSGLFYATRLQMRAQDMIYVSNAPSTDLAKVLALVLPAAYSTANFSVIK